MRTGALIGYARVSTPGQLFDHQQRALAEVGCIRVFADKLAGITPQHGSARWHQGKPKENTGS